MSGQRSRIVTWIGIVALAAAASACSELLNPFLPSSTTSNGGSSSSSSSSSPSSSAFTITSATLAVDNSALANVTCPANVTFTATLTSNKDGVIAYRWERSDGSSTPTQTLAFPSATSLTAINVWAVSVNTSGWQRLHVVTPSDVASNAVNFTVTCK